MQLPNFQGKKKEKNLGLDVCVWFGTYVHDSMNMIIRREICKTLKLIITLLWQLSASACQFSLNTSFIFSFQPVAGETVYCCKRESLTPFLSP